MYIKKKVYAKNVKTTIIKNIQKTPHIRKNHARKVLKCSKVKTVNIRKKLE